MKIQININESPKELIITISKYELICTIFTTSEELLSAYGLTSSQLNLDVLKMIISERKLRILKSYNFSSIVEEWSSRGLDFSFKQENDLVSCQRNEDGKVIYIKEKDLYKGDKFRFTNEMFEKLEKEIEEKKEKAIVLAKNINTNFDLGL